MCQIHGWLVVGATTLDVSKLHYIFFTDEWLKLRKRLIPLHTRGNIPLLNCNNRPPLTLVDGHPRQRLLQCSDAIVRHVR